MDVQNWQELALNRTEQRKFRSGENNAFEDGCLRRAQISRDRRRGFHSDLPADAVLKMWRISRVCGCRGRVM